MHSLAVHTLSIHSSMVYFRKCNSGITQGSQSQLRACTYMDCFSLEGLTLTSSTTHFRCTHRGNLYWSNSTFPAPNPYTREEASS